MERRSERPARSCLCLLRPTAGAGDLASESGQWEGLGRMMTYQQDRVRTFRSQLERSMDDQMADSEIARCAAEREKANGNGNGSNGTCVCDCPETLVNGVRVSLHRAIDCTYAKARSKLVLVAVALTNAEVPNVRATVWAKRFNQEMSRLSAPLLRESRNGSSGDHKTDPEPGYKWVS